MKMICNTLVFGKIPVITQVSCAVVAIHELPLHTVTQVVMSHWRHPETMKMFNFQTVGWVKRSRPINHCTMGQAKQTHQSSFIVMGALSLHPSYAKIMRYKNLGMFSSGRQRCRSILEKQGRRTRSVCNTHAAPISPMTKWVCNAFPVSRVKAASERIGARRCTSLRL